MEPEIIEKGPIQLLGVLTVGQPDKLDYNDIWANQVMKYDELLKAHSVDQAYYGVWFGEDADHLAYLAGMAIDCVDEIPAGLVLRVLPPRRYAVFHCTISTISRTYPEIYQNWLPTSPYQFAPGASDFEYYPPHGETDEIPAAIFIPIVEKIKQETA